MRWLGLLLSIACTASCGRSGQMGRHDASSNSPPANPDLSPADAPPPPADAPPMDEPGRDSPTDPPSGGLRDRPADSPFDPPPELPRADAGADPPERDLSADRTPPDRAPPPADSSPAISCGALAAIADRGVLTRQRTTEVIFAPDRSFVALKVRPEGDAGGAPDQLLRVALPSGEVTTVSSSGDSAEALGAAGLMLVVGTSSAGGRLAVYENGALRTLAQGACGHVATPDGARIYVVRDCTGGRGTLDVVDVASGQATTLASNVLGDAVTLPSFAVSPSGAHVAFLARSPDGGVGDVLHIADRSGKVYALASHPAATAPQFVSDERLLFAVHATGYPSVNSDLRVHVPGTGDTSYSVATGRNVGLFGYKISADGEHLLGATPLRNDASFEGSGLLYAIRLDGSGENLLSSSLVPYWQNERALRVFEWSGDGRRAVYQADQGAGIWANGSDGASPVQLSPGSNFRAAPVGDQVAVIESAGDARQNRVRVVSAGSGSEFAAFVSDGYLTAPNFTPDGRGLLFVAGLSSGAQLRYLSATIPGSVVLGEWKETLLDTSPGIYGDPPGKYPVDPTGCFTVVDTDLAPGPGARLVVMPDW